MYKDLAFCENPLEREQEVEDIKVEKIRSLQEVTFFTYNEDGFDQRFSLSEIVLIFLTMLDLSILIIMKLCQVVSGVKEAKYPSLNYQRCLD